MSKKHRSKKNYKKNCFSVPSKPILALGIISKEKMLDFFTAHMERYTECKLSDSGVKTVSSSEIKLPISGNWFVVDVNEFDNRVANVLAKFWTYVSEEYSVRVFEDLSEIRLFFAIDAPEEEIAHIFDVIMRMHDFGKIKTLRK